MADRVHIKIADRDWILEKCAREIARRANNVGYGIDPDPSADLQYYVNYSARSTKVSRKEVAFFTHSEHDPDARRRYFEAAKEVDHCVCMSERYARELIDSGIPPEKVTTIAPGVDLDEFRPKVRIGVVGRTYHTGRKGEALVAQVMNTPGIEWRFSGTGWPGPSVAVPEGGMAEFYNELDYVLVPSLYEGGPLSVLEGLACGIPIIASDVGWVSEYPHIPFENGNAESLRQVLTDVVAEREALRFSVLDRTWDRWAEEHLELFDRLLGSGLTGATTDTSSAQGANVTLLTHGPESKAKGGPSVRVPRTAIALRDVGVAARYDTFPGPDSLDGELIHLFNVWPPRSSVETARAIAAAGKRLVFSPILLDLSEMDFWQRRVMAAIADRVDEPVLERLQLEYRERIGWASRRNPEPGFTSRVRELAELSDALIFLSKREQALFQELAGKQRFTRLIHNPVDSSRFSGADPQLFRDFVRLDDFILCVGRIEPRKNQLLLVAAAKQLGLPVVLVGGTAASGAYAEAVRTYGGEMVRLVGRIAPASDFLSSAYAACRVFALPSWAEGAPLAALEAAASGASLVLSNRSGEEEYFGEIAQYVEPSSVESIKTALEAAWSRRRETAHASELWRKFSDAHSWSRYAAETAAVYREVLGRERSSIRTVVPKGIAYNLGEVISAEECPSHQQSDTDALASTSAGWGSEPRFTLSCRPIPRADLALVARLRSLESERTVRVRVNGRTVAKWKLPAGSEVVRCVPFKKGMASTGQIELRFTSEPAPATASEEARGGTGRAQSLELLALQVAEQTSEDLWNGLFQLRPLPVGERIDLGNAAELISSTGFHPPEPAGMWSGRNGEIYLRLPQLRSPTLRIDVKVPLATSNAILRLSHGERSTEQVLQTPGEHVVDFPLSGKTALPVTVELSTEQLFVPSESGSLDERRLGILASAVTVVPGSARKTLLKRVRRLLD